MSASSKQRAAKQQAAQPALREPSLRPFDLVYYATANWIMSAAVTRVQTQPDGFEFIECHFQQDILRLPSSQVTRKWPEAVARHQAQLAALLAKEGVTSYVELVAKKQREQAEKRAATVPAPTPPAPEITAENPVAATTAP